MTCSRLPALLLLSTLQVWLLAASTSASAQQARQATSEEQLINWYYAAVFGTGVYRSGDRTVSVLQIPFSHELRPLTEEHSGIKLTFPVSFGFYDFRFDEFLDGATPHSLSTAIIFPGIEMDVRMASNWMLKPYASVGYGWELSGNGSATLYAIGVKSRVGLPIGGDAELSLGNQLTLSGYRPDGQANQPLGLFIAGLNLEVPTRFRLFDRAMTLGYHLIYYQYFSRLRDPRADNVDNTISEQGEIGISLLARKPISLELFDLERVGIAFRVGDGIQAVRLFFNLPY